MQSSTNRELNDATPAKALRNGRTGKQATAAKPTKSKIVQVQSKSSKAPVSTANAHRTSKQDLVLSMLNQKGGTTIADIMASTDWQTHTVRGFLAGTVKKKLCLALTSSKAAGELRRYRIEMRRSR